MIISPIVIFNSLSAVCGNQYLTAINDTKTLTKSYCIGATLNLIFNAILIPIFSGVGAALGTIIAEFTVFIIQYQVVKKIIDKNLLRKNFIRYFLSGVFMFIMCNLIGYYHSPTVLTTIIQVCIGIFSYFSILLITKDELTYNMLNILINKLKTRKEIINHEK